MNLRTHTSRVACLFLSAVLTAASVQAAEVTVQNDSLTGGQTGSVFVGFASGERAAAWLTSPCDGNIVAVQILWLDNNELTSGAQSFEDSITVYAAGTFPNPGTELAYLEAPVLTEGFLNEFRYLDENQTIPLNVPVAAGEKFVVSFQFLNAPNQSTGPSVVRDSGCQSGKNAVYCVGGLCAGWNNSCALGVLGDWVIRAVIDCGENSGACCLPDGSCDSLTPTDCSLAGGTYQGDFVACGSVSCPQPEGGCCFPSTGNCLTLTEADCMTANGDWQGPTFECGVDTCYPVGACCLPDGQCQDSTTPEDCAAMSGTFMGDGSDCGSTSCPEPTGACCFSETACLVMTENNCGVASGMWMGVGTDCADNDGNGKKDACEAGANCPADLDGSMTVDLTDLGMLLGDYGSPCGSCIGDISNDGNTDLTDLGMLLGSYGPCP